MASLMASESELILAMEDDYPADMTPEEEVEWVPLEFDDVDDEEEEPEDLEDILDQIWIQTITDTEVHFRSFGCVSDSYYPTLETILEEDEEDEEDAKYSGYNNEPPITASDNISVCVRRTISRILFNDEDEDVEEDGADIISVGLRRFTSRILYNDEDEDVEEDRADIISVTAEEEEDIERVPLESDHLDDDNDDLTDDIMDQKRRGPRDTKRSRLTRFVRFCRRFFCCCIPIPAEDYG